MDSRDLDGPLVLGVRRRPFRAHLTIWELWRQHDPSEVQPNPQTKFLLLKHVRSIFNLTASSLPPGLDVDVVLERTKPLDFLDIYRSIITAIQKIGAEIPWEHEVTGRTDTSLEGSNIDLMFRTLVTPRMRHEMQAGYIILGLQKAVNMMAQESVFCEASVKLSFRSQRVGKITITRRLHAPGLPAEAPTISATKDMEKPSSIGSNMKSIKSSIVALGKRANPYDDPELYDRRDRRFKITYQLQSDPMPKEGVLSAVLDAMVMIAQKGYLEVCTDLHAHSLTGGAKIWVTYFGNTSKPLRFGWVSKALTMIWETLMVRDNNWYEVNFLMWYDEKPLGIGYFYNT